IFRAFLRSPSTTRPTSYHLVRKIGWQIGWQLMQRRSRDGVDAFVFHQERLDRPLAAVRDGALFVGRGSVSLEVRGHLLSLLRVIHVRRQQAAAGPSRAASEWRKLARARPEQARRELQGGWTRERLISMNDRFVERLERAFRLGLERRIALTPDGLGQATFNGLETSELSERLTLSTIWNRAIITVVSACGESARSMSAGVHVRPLMRLRTVMTASTSWLSSHSST